MKDVQNSLSTKNSLFIGVENLDELNELIEDVKNKEKALHDAVHKLENFKLEISFINK